MRGWSEGDTVSATTIIMTLLWQQYGLDLRHPEVSRWLEQNAPDVKYAIAEDQFAKGHDRTKFRVGINRIVTVYLTLEVDDRLREVSTRYLLRQLERPVEPQKEQIEPELVRAMIRQANASGLSINDYLARLLGSTLPYHEELPLSDIHYKVRPRKVV